VEREAELAAIGAHLERARAGTGGLLLVEGPAGIGKTSVLREARQAAEAVGMTVLHGTGTEFEREYPFGVVRQCLSPVVRREDDRRRLLTGAAGLAEPALLDVADPIPATFFGLLNGLYWLLATLADERPALLVVDDAQWADEPSLRFLGYLARRVDSIAVAVVVAARREVDFAPESPALREVRDHARAHRERLALRPLATPGVAELARTLSGSPVDEDFAEACRRATGGNPFLVDELLRALRDGGVPFTAAQAAGAGRSPGGVTRSVGATLDRLGPDARALARAVAILGEGSELELAAQLARVARAAAAPSAAALAAAGILEDDARLTFRHPILAGAVRDGMAVHERAAEHARAAELLRARGAAPERVALQLLHVEPAGDPRVVAELRVAAGHARERGAPASAATLLTRALSEPPAPGERADVLVELGRAELDQGRASDAWDHLSEARRCAVDPRTRGLSVALLAMAVPGDRAARAALMELVEQMLPEVAAHDRELGLRLRATLAIAGGSADDLALEGSTVAEAMVLGQMIFARMDPGARADELAGLALRGARQVDALLEEGAIGLAFTGIVLALRWADRLEDAERLLDRAIEVARRRGSTSDFAIAMTLRAAVHRRAGRLRDAEADARMALPAGLDHQWLFARGVAPLVGTLLDQGRVADAAAELSAVMPDGDEVPDSPPMIPVVLARMAVYAARREHERALAAWRVAVARVDELRGINAGWIEDLVVVAGVHQARGDAAAARAAAARAGTLAERWGTSGARGQALHAQARTGAVDDAEAALEEAVALLAASPVRLEHARALVALGALRRRGGRRADSRAPLREGYHLALGSGALALAETARAELRASGIRVARERPTGGDALTASERRIAGMAADGLSNAEIAQELFLTVKTVEMHLTHAYRRLAISGRAELAGALARGSQGPVQGRPRRGPAPPTG
jgi:DNA-binding CsgD family transcriptional regulator